MERSDYETLVNSLTGMIGVGEGAAGREWQSAENVLTRAHDFALQTNDQQFQEHLAYVQAAIDKDMLITGQDWQSIQNDLDRQLQVAMQNNDIAAQINILQMKQEFEGQQAEMDRALQTNLAQMQYDFETWQQGRVEALTRSGWDHESAMQLAQQEFDSFENNRDRLLQAEIESGRITQAQAELLETARQFDSQQAWETWATQQNIALEEARMAWQSNEALAERSWQAGENSLDRILQREVEAGRLDLATAELAEKTRQFDSQQDFEREMALLGYDQDAIARAWQAGENALDREHDQIMFTLQTEFEKYGLSWQAVMASTADMEPEQAVAFIQQMAKDNGILIPELTPEQMSQAAVSTAVDVALQGGVLPAAQVQTIIDAFKAGDDMGGNVTGTWGINAVGEYESTGDNRWILDSKSRSWVEANQGKLLVRGTKVYEVVGSWSPDSSLKGYAAYIILRDVATGTTYNYVGGKTYGQTPTNMGSLTRDLPA
jgi:hypothetical protein